MKKVFIILLSCLSFNGWSQRNQVAPEKCATAFSYEQRVKNNPDLIQQRKSAEGDAKSWLKDNPGFRKNQRNGVLTIPVVFHVVYNSGDSVNQNIPDSLILSQLDVLNTDYRRRNADTINTRAVFDSIAADMGIEFCLATIDPNGNPTTGITRTPTTAQFFQSPTNNGVKFDSTGGKNVWPADHYLNIWICDMSIFTIPFVLGYAQFPGDDPATDGVVLQFQFVGRTNNATYPTNNLGRTATHEVGHWLGLHHIWGDTANLCSAYNDYIFDTPDATSQSQQNCQLTANTCNDAGNPFWNGYNPPNMVENYMDYSSEQCMNSFTLGQSDRIWSFLETDRSGLFTSNGCGIQALNAFADINDPVCPDSCSATAEINPVAGTPPYTFLWNDALAQTDSIATGLCAGDYICMVTDADNDTVYVNVNIASPLNIVTNYVVTPATCSTCLNGMIDINTQFGNSPFTFTLDGGFPQGDSLFVYLNPGTYYIETTDLCGTVTGDSVTVTMFNSVNEINVLNEFTLQPNPASETVVFSFGKNNYSKKIELFNAIGEILFTENTNSGQLVKNISSLEKGIYFVRVTYSFGVITRKLVVD